jgi:membrane fusion protein (multidrug efflux system)
MARGRSASGIDGRRSSVAAASADIAAARVLLETAEAGHARTLRPHAAGLVTQTVMERATADLEAARQAAGRADAMVAERRAGVCEAEADAGEAGAIDRDIEALSLAAHALRPRIALQKVELEQHTIASPLNGEIDEVFADAGEHVAPGARIALAQDPADMWIEANIKGTDLGRVQVGADVEIRLDAQRRGHAVGACSALARQRHRSLR